MINKDDIDKNWFINERITSLDKTIKAEEELEPTSFYLPIILTLIAIIFISSFLGVEFTHDHPAIIVFSSVILTLILVATKFIMYFGKYDNNRRKRERDELLMYISIDELVDMKDNISKKEKMLDSYLQEIDTEEKEEKPSAIQLITQIVAFILILILFFISVSGIYDNPISVVFLTLVFSLFIFGYKRQRVKYREKLDRYWLENQYGYLKKTEKNITLGKQQLVKYFQEISWRIENEKTEEISFLIAMIGFGIPALLLFLGTVLDYSFTHKYQAIIVFLTFVSMAM